MKLVTFLKDGHLTLGVKTEKGIIDIRASLAVSPNEGIPIDMMSLIQAGSSSIFKLKEYIDENDQLLVLNEKEIEWGPCVSEPQKIICVGLNYRRHADETNAPYPEVPILFSKFNNSLTSHLSDITVPKVTDKLDYEVELGIVIGKKAKSVTTEESLEHVFGYCTVNDLSARDLQMRTHQWLLGKTSDGFCPVGPYLVTADEVGDPQNLQLTTKVNGEVRQHSSTSDMIFSCAEIVSYISQHMTLEPGDLILTGTPEGVVLGYPEEQQVYLNPGDVVTVEVEKLGALTNRLVKEK